MIVETISTTCFTSPRFADPNARYARTSSSAPVPNTARLTAMMMMVARSNCGSTSRAQY